MPAMWERAMLWCATPFRVWRDSQASNCDCRVLACSCSTTATSTPCSAPALCASVSAPPGATPTAPSRAPCTSPEATQVIYLSFCWYMQCPPAWQHRTPSHSTGHPILPVICLSCHACHAIQDMVADSAVRSQQCQGASRTRKPSRPSWCRKVVRRWLQELWTGGLSGSPGRQAAHDECFSLQGAR